MGKILTVSLVLFLTVFAPPVWAQEDSPYELFSPDQLDNLLAPIALYPDPLLAQVLVAATFPDQIDEAARFVRDDSSADDVDGLPWDVSVKAVAHYPTVLAVMADKLDWTTALGQAYANQSTDVMASVQRLRAQARSAGNLVTTSELEVVESGGEIELWPAQSQYLYVPQYDPAVVFFYRAPLFFGARFFIGAWLNYDFDWGRHRIYYHGWEGNSGWTRRSRQYIHPNPHYLSDTYRNVRINRSVTDRRVNHGALNRYDDVHRTTNFNNFRRNNRVVNQPPLPLSHVTVPNKIINRNFDPTNSRINDYRGHAPQRPEQIRVPLRPALTPFRGGLDPRVTSRRGQISRALVPPTPPPVEHRKKVTQLPRPPARKEKPKDEHRH